MTLFIDRADAGRRLADALRRFAAEGERGAREGGGEPPVVVALPRGGVVVGFEVARALGAPLEVMVVRKVGAPQQPELAIGAVAEMGGPIVLLDERLIARLGIPRALVERTVERELAEVRRRRGAYLGGRSPTPPSPPTPLTGRTVIVVDDGIATGATARVALRALRRLDPARLVLALPVAPAESVREMQDEADELVVLSTPSPFHAVGMHYERFDQTSDEEVLDLLHRAEAFAP